MPKRRKKPNAKLQCKLGNKRILLFLFYAGQEGTSSGRDVTSRDDYSFSMLDAFVPLPSDNEQSPGYCRCKRGAVVSDPICLNISSPQYALYFPKVNLLIFAVIDL